MNSHKISRDVSSIATRCAAMTATTFAIISTSAVLASAGTLTPPGPPAATMRTLEEQKPAWNKIIPAAQRFADALDGNAVLDKETGLVWAKMPDSIQRTWLAAIDYCTQLNLGGRMGWRLPAVEELATLIDRSNTNLSTPAIPIGHPFQNIKLGPYWSFTTQISDTTGAVVVDTGYGGAFYNVSKVNPGSFVWPVRSGQ